jgi:hypothetical protein
MHLNRQSNVDGILERAELQHNSIEHGQLVCGDLAVDLREIGC